MINAARLKVDSLIKGLLYSGLFVALYHSSHLFMVQWWQQKDYNYCYLIPLVVLYLTWEKRNHLIRFPAKPSWEGFIPLVFGLVLFWLGELGGEYYTMYLSSWFVLLGLCWMHLGWRKLKIVLFPIGMILTMFPPPNIIYFNLSLKLKLISSKLGVWALQTIGKTAYREGNVIDLGFAQLQVVDACNGIRYLFPLIVLSILVAYFYRSAWWKQVFIVVSAIPISIIVNGLRIASVGLLYPVWGPQVAEGFLHDFSGWAIFMISLGTILSEMWILNRLVPEKTTCQNDADVPLFIDPDEIRGKGDSIPAKPWRNFIRSPLFFAAVLLMGATALIAQKISFREAIPITRPLKQFPMQVGQWSGESITMEQKFLDELNLADYIVTDFKSASGKSVNFYTAYYESQRKGKSIHSPASCLPGNGWVFNESGKVIIQRGGDDKSYVRIKRAFIQKGDYRQLTYYWFPMRGRILTTMWEMKLFNFWDALTRRRTDGALVRLITPVYGDETVEKAEERLQTFVGDIMPVLDDFIPQ